VIIHGRDIFWFSASLALTASGEQWLDDLVAKDNKCGHGAQPFAGRAIAVRGTDPLDQLLAAKFLEIVGGLSRRVAAV
jgi:hypothetical protein